MFDENKRSDFIKKIMLLTRSNRHIVLFGNSGSGKSQFVTSMKEVVTIPQRNLTTKKVRLNVEDFPLKFIDTPGHNESIHIRRAEVQNIIKDGAEGIINLVSFGFEETPNADRSVAYDDQDQIKQDFLEQNRKQEIERLAEWLPQVNPDNTKWIINLVNKSDIWWDEHTLVHDYYTKGAYRQSFNGIDKFIPVITIPYCAIIRPFFKVKTSGKFGEEEKQSLHNYFVSTLLNLLNKNN